MVETKGGESGTRRQEASWQRTQTEGGLVMCSCRLPSVKVRQHLLYGPQTSSSALRIIQSLKFPTLGNSALGPHSQISRHLCVTLRLIYVLTWMHFCSCHQESQNPAGLLNGMETQAFTAITYSSTHFIVRETLGNEPQATLFPTFITLSFVFH